MQIPCRGCVDATLAVLALGRVRAASSSSLPRVLVRRLALAVWATRFDDEWGEPGALRDACALVARGLFLTEEALRESALPLFAPRTMAVNFFIDNVWCLLDPDWAAFFDAHCQERLDVSLGQRLQLPPNAELAAPASLLAWLEAVRTLRLLPLSPAPAHVQPLDAALLHGVKAKKRGEVAALAALVHRVAQRCGATVVVDIGAGHGHLARVLAWMYGYHVIGVDCDHSTHARAKSDLLEPLVAPPAHQRKGSLHFVQQRISLANAAQALQDVLAAHTTPEQRVLLVGLHTCGDLAVTMHQLFSVAGPSVVALVSVPCCYMKRVVQGHEPDDEHDPGALEQRIRFAPLSAAVQAALGAVRLTESSLSAACHGVGHKPQGTSALTVWRCVYQRQLWQRTGWSAERLAAVRVPTVSLSSCASYAAYVARVNTDEAPHAQEPDARDANRVRVWWALKECVGSAIEQLILYDRVAYCAERGARSVEAVRLLESPRAVAIVVLK